MSIVVTVLLEYINYIDFEVDIFWHDSWLRGWKATLIFGVTLHS